MSKPQRYFLQLAYNGENYHGWQVQDNAETVQQKLQESLSTILREEISVIGCGRTDTGVHAKDFFAHFDVEKKIPNPAKEVFKINSILPKDIAIYDLFPVDNETHTRFDAISRTYEYVISQEKNPFSQGLAYHFNRPLDLEKMNEAAKHFLEVEDFSSFSKSGTQVKTNICNVTQAQWEKDGKTLKFTITANRFLRNMVRAVVGTLMEVGLEKINLEEFKNIVASRNRSNAGYSVPAEGLFLVKVE